MKLGPHTITVLRAAQREPEYGTRPELDWSNPTRTDVHACSVQPMPSPEYAIDRDAVLTHWIVYAPPLVDISALDRIEWSGDVYDIDGDVLRWEFGALSHLVFNLRKSEG